MRRTKLTIHRMLPSHELCSDSERLNPYYTPREKARYKMGYNLFEHKELHWLGDLRCAPWNQAGVRWRESWLVQIPDDHWIEEMLLTDPPITKALIQKETYPNDDASARRGWDLVDEDLDFIFSPGLDITHLRDFESPNVLGRLDVYKFAESDEWLPVPKGVRTTGWEMLWVLETEGKHRTELLQEMELAAYPDRHPSGIYS